MKKFTFDYYLHEVNMKEFIINIKKKKKMEEIYV